MDRTPTNITSALGRAIRVCGAAAIAGGALRIAEAYLATTNAVRAQQVAYLITDIFLALGLCGIYASLHKILGLVGLLAFLVSLAGLLVVRASALFPVGAGAYLIGATITLVGTVGLGTVLLARSAFPHAGPVLWIASLVVGLAGMAPGAPAWFVALAGVIFGAGFIAAGAALLRPVAVHESR